jgi:TRAP-type C4-dicarboxylate transport system permease small subunit
MGLAYAAEQRVGIFLGHLSKVLAYVGGFILTAMAVLTVVSIIGRALLAFGLGPLKGDYELVANGCALAVFCFLPYCQLNRGHVTVDILTSQFSARIQAFFGFLGDLMIAVAAIVITRQLWLGFGEKFPYGSDALRGALGMGYKPFFPETTYELEIPIWIPYGIALTMACVFVLVAVYCVWRSLNWVIAGQEVKP